MEPIILLVVINVALLVCLVMYVTRSQKREAIHHSEMAKLQEKLDKKLEKASNEAEGPSGEPQEKRILWRVGDRTEVDIGNGMYSIARILDFTDDNEEEIVEAELLFEGEIIGTRGRWFVLADDLRKLREGSPEAPVVATSPVVPETKP